MHELKLKRSYEPESEEDGSCLLQIWVSMGEREIFGACPV